MKKSTSIITISLSMFKAFVFLILLSSCNKDFPNILKEYGDQPDYPSGSSKVLYIIVDGIRGKTMQQMDNLPNFRVIARNSLHTFGSLGDYQNNAFTKEAGLANLLTGVTNNKHGVVSNDLSQANLNQYPSLLTRINSLSSDFSSSAFTRNSMLSTTLFKDADINVVAQSDDEVVSEVSEELVNGSSDFIVANLSDPYEVGMTHSFEPTSIEYTAAIRKFDQQVGKLIDAIKNRSSYNQENWLVVITSSIGGEVASQGIDNTLYGDDERNTITYFYSPKFTRGLLVRPNSTEIPFVGNAVRFNYPSGAARAESISKEAFNYDASTDFTINFFYKQTNSGVQNYPVILNKRESFDGGNGWQIMLSGGQPELASSLGGKIKGGRIDDALWHSITVVVSRSGSLDSAKIFVDGVLGQKTAVNSNAITTLKPFTIGKIDGYSSNNADFMMSNLQVYKGVAYTNVEVAKYHGLASISIDNNPYFNKLDGYWPGYNDIGKSRLIDVSPAANDLILSGPYNWQSFNDIVPSFIPPITDSFYKLVPNSVDLPFFIYQWFGIIPVESWALDGKSWSPSLLISSE